MNTKENSISTLIKKYKENGKSAELLAILDRMKPLINKYAKKLFKIEFEDANQEMILALIESVNKMSCYENDGQCISYFNRALNNKYHELCRTSRKIENEYSMDDINIESRTNPHNDYIDTEFYFDLYTMISDNHDTNNSIISYIIENDASDTEIAKRLGISRQYVNRFKKRIFKPLLYY